MGKVMINQGRSLPWTFRFIAVLIVFTLIVVSMQNLPERLAIPIAILLSFLFPMIWFSNKILTIDNDLKEIHEGYWIMGYKTGKRKKYKSVDKIFINKVKTSQSMYSQSNHGHSVKGVEYHAYLKYDEDKKLFLAGDPLEKRLENKMTKIREKLGLS
ncbi:MAG: hypothetical protein ABJG78_05205 [Cyclobacteriaceae bacterium]